MTCNETIDLLVRCVSKSIDMNTIDDHDSGNRVEIISIDATRFLKALEAERETAVPDGFKLMEKKCKQVLTPEGLPLFDNVDVAAHSLFKVFSAEDMTEAILPDEFHMVASHLLSSGWSYDAEREKGEI